MATVHILTFSLLLANLLRFFRLSMVIWSSVANKIKSLQQTEKQTRTKKITHSRTCYLTIHVYVCVLRHQNGTDTNMV